MMKIIPVAMVDKMFSVNLSSLFFYEVCQIYPGMLSFVN